MIEVFVRLGLALLLSLSLALLMAWGWHSSDRAPDALYSASSENSVSTPPAIPNN
ncbi:hypothetical protein [Hydrogenophaga sp.]|uniref:hypothetical protein n=1 Tax=Hydrogenophaga sp. TaxID=1904254 RepID=UPI002610C3B4|nr:hypothetical protein [Hydrogenophaga sp.]MDM7948877.1 hypothetical protein [Hydrogenophaga sp.]